jgi:hypothetical protein
MSMIVMSRPIYLIGFNTVLLLHLQLIFFEHHIFPVPISVDTQFYKPVIHEPLPLQVCYNNTLSSNSFTSSSGLRSLDVAEIVSFLMVDV